MMSFQFFSPLDSINVSETIKDLYLFARNLASKFIFDKERKQANLERELVKRTKHFSMEEFRALRDLMLLYDEGATDDTSSSSPPSKESKVETVHPPAQPVSRFKLTCTAIWALLHQSIIDLKKETWPKIPPNLNKGQIQALKSLQKCTNIVIKPLDKAGNIVIMTHTHY